MTKPAVRMSLASKEKFDSSEAKVESGKGSIAGIVPVLVSSHS